MNAIGKRSLARRGWAGAGFAVLLALSAAPARAAAGDPAQAKVDAFDDALISAMKAGAAAGPKGRERQLSPAVESAFDLPTMTRFAVGPAWAGMTDAQHAALTSAFGRYTSANYAHNFDAYSGQKFEVQGVQVRGADKLVQVRLASAKSTPVALVYRVHGAPAGWKIVDVFYNGISQLATRRSDFASAAAQGAPALQAQMDRLTAKLLE